MPEVSNGEPHREGVGEHPKIPPSEMLHHLSENLFSPRDFPRPLSEFEQISILEPSLSFIKDPKLLAAFHAAHFSCGPQELRAEIERAVLADDYHNSGFFLASLALILLDPSENSMRQICEAVRRACRYKKAPIFYAVRHEAWEREFAPQVLRRLDEYLRPYVSSEMLPSVFYDEHYADVSYDDIRARPVGPDAQGADMFAQMRNGLPITKAIWTDQMKNVPGSPPLLQLLMKTIVESRRVLPAQADDGFAMALAQMKHPTHFMNAAMGIDSATDSRDRPAVECFGEKFRLEIDRSILQDPAKIWQTFIWLQSLVSVHPHAAREGKGENTDLFFDIIARIPARHPAQLVRGFFEDTDIAMCSFGFSKMPHACHDMALREMLAEEGLFSDPLLRAKAAIIFHNKPIARADFASLAARKFPKDAAAFEAVLEGGVKIMELAFRGSEEATGWREQVLRQRSRRVTSPTLADGAHFVDTAATRTRKPTVLTAGAYFAERIRRALEGHALPPTLRSASYAAIGFAEGVREMAALVCSDPTMKNDPEMWPEVDAVTVVTTPESALRRLGVSGLSFDFPQPDRPDITVEMIYESGNGNGGNGGNGGGRKHEPARITQEGKFILDGLSADVEWIAHVVEAEVLAALTREDTGPLNIQLGLQDYVAPSQPVISDEGGGDAAGEEGGETTPDLLTTPEERTREFFAQNSEAFRVFVDSIKADPKFDIPGTYSEISGILADLQASIASNGLSRRIPSGGAPILPLKDHILAPMIELIDLYPVATTRQTLHNMDLAPAAFHGAEDLLDERGELDAYLVFLHVQIAEKGTQQIVACILPPRFDVYFLGVDPADWDEEKDVTAKGVAHLVLEAFRTATGREYSTENTRSSVSNNAKEGPAWIVQMRNVIENIAQARYPTIVMERTEKKKAPDEIGALSQSAERRVKSDDIGKAHEETRFLKILTEPGNFIEVLSAFGACLSAQTYLRFMLDAQKVLPPDALTSRDGCVALKAGWQDLYIPLDAEHVEAAIKLLVDSGEFTPEEVLILTTDPLAYRMPFEIANRAASDSADYPFIFDGTNEPYIIVPGTRAAISRESPGKLLRGEKRRPPANFAAEIQNPYHHPRSGQELSLDPKMCALLVWQFDDGRYGFRYLDAMKDVPDRNSLTRITGAERLIKYSPRVDSAITRTRIENASGAHTDFVNWQEWKPWDLPRLVEENIIQVTRDSRGQVTGVSPRCQVVRKKVAILPEHRGYRQSQTTPSNLAQLIDFGIVQCVDVWQLMGHTAH